MYYEKVGLAYGTASGREIQPDYPLSGLDIQPKIDEFRIVGPTGGGTEISTIIAGDGTTLGATEDNYSHSYRQSQVLRLIQPSR